MLRKNLTTLRNLHGLSQESVAEIIGISRQAYAKWEKGETIPDVDKCAKLAEYYGITIDALVSSGVEGRKMAAGQAPKGKHIWGTVIVNERGQIVIPKGARELFQIHSGDRLIVLGDETQGIALMKAEAFEEGIRQMLEHSNRVQTD